MTKEKSELIKAAYIEACRFYPVVTYAMKKAAPLIAPRSHPVTEEDFQTVYSCPIFLIEEARKRRWLANIGENYDFLMDFFAEAISDLESKQGVRGLDPSRIRYENSVNTNDFNLAEYTTKKMELEQWREIIQELKRDQKEKT